MTWQLFRDATISFVYDSRLAHRMLFVIKYVQFPFYRGISCFMATICPPKLTPCSVHVTTQHI